MAYRTGAGSRRQLTWFDRSGTALGTLGDPDAVVSSIPACRPTAAAWPCVARCRATPTSGCWTAPARAASRSMRRRLLSPLVARRHPDRVQLEPDGHQATSIRSSRAARAWRSARGLRPVQGAHSWSADGRFLLYAASTRRRAPTSGCADERGNRTPSVFLKTPFARLGRVLAGRPVGGLQVERIGAEGDLRAAVRPARRGGHGSSGAGASGRSPRRAAFIPLAARRQGTVLPQPGGRDDGGADRRHRVHARNRARRRCSFPRGSSAAAWTQQGRQYDVAPDGRFLINTVLDERRRADHAAAELESRGEEVVPRG